MKAKQLAILIIVAAVLVGLAVMTSRDEQASKPALIGKPVLADLAVNEIRQVVVRSATSTSSVVRASDGWACPGSFDYPADFAKIKALLLKLSELKIGQVTKLDDAQRANLKMVLPGSGQGEAGTVIDLFAEGGAPVASLLVGADHTKKSSGEQQMPYGYGGSYPDGRYVSPDGGESVYLVTETLRDLPGDEKGWLDTELLSVSASDVTAVTITHTNGDAVSLTRPEGGSDLEVPDLAETEEMDTSKSYGLKSALSYLRFSEVADPSTPDGALGMTAPTVFEARTAKGEIYTVKVGGSPDGSSGRYIRLSAALEPVEEAAAQTEETDDAADANAPDTERLELETKIADLNAKLAPWTFVVESYKADSLTRTRTDLVKEKEVEEDEAEEAETPDAEATGEPGSASQAPTDTPPDAVEAPAAETAPVEPEPAAAAPVAAPVPEAEPEPRAVVTPPEAGVTEAEETGDAPAPPAETAPDEAAPAPVQDAAADEKGS